MVSRDRRESLAGATATAPARLGFSPDHYLDCRRPEWVLYEARGLVLFRRELGAKKSLVFVDDDCIEVLAALRTHGYRPLPSVS
jgi:hypothetical protein